MDKNIEKYSLKKNKYNCIKHFCKIKLFKLFYLTINFII